MLHYEIAIAIIGILATVMGILIAFEITFPTQVHYKLYREIFGSLSEYKRHKETIKIESFWLKNLKDELERMYKSITKEILVISCGVVIIVLLIFQTFTWQIDPKTNLISSDNFDFLVGSLILGFFWIGYLIYQIYKFRSSLYKFLLTDVEKIEEEKNP